MKRSVLLAFLVFILGCGYHLVGTQRYEKAVSLSGKKVMVLPFANRVGEPEVESIFTRALVNELLKTGKIILTSSKEDADFIITGKVVGYNRETMSVDEKGDVLTYRLTMMVDVTVKDKRNKVVANYSGLSDYEDYPAYEDIERTKDAERAAVRSISQSIAQMLASLLI